MREGDYAGLGGFLETECGGEDDFAALAGLDGARCKAAALSYALNGIYDRDIGIAGEHKIAMHRVNEEIVSNGMLGSFETLRNDGAAVNTSSARRMP